MTFFSKKAWLRPVPVIQRLDIQRVSAKSGPTPGTSTRFAARYAGRSNTVLESTAAAATTSSARSKTNTSLTDAGWQKHTSASQQMRNAH